jgi:hypothetical protein
MKNLFISYELALKLKDKGFYEPCFSKYYESGKLSDSLSYLNHNYIKQINAPLYQQVVDWFIEKHKIFIMIYPRDKWNYMVQGIDESISCSGESFHGEKFESYHEALEKAIEEALKLI